MGVTNPIKFNDLITLNAYYEKFNSECIQICTNYNVLDYYNSIKIIKDEKKIELYILRMGSYGSGTNDEKASKEILRAFDNIFNN